MIQYPIGPKRSTGIKDHNKTVCLRHWKETYQRLLSGSKNIQRHQRYSIGSKRSQGINPQRKRLLRYGTAYQVRINVNCISHHVMLTMLWALFSLDRSCLIGTGLPNAERFGMLAGFGQSWNHLDTILRRRKTSEPRPSMHNWYYGEVSLA